MKRSALLWLLFGIALFLFPFWIAPYSAFRGLRDYVIVFFGASLVFLGIGAYIQIRGKGGDTL